MWGGGVLLFFHLSECNILSYKNMKPENHLKFGYWQLQSKYNCIHFSMAT